MSLCWGDRGDPELDQLGMKEPCLSGPLTADNPSGRHVAKVTSSKSSRPDLTRPDLNDSKETNDYKIPITGSRSRSRSRRSSEGLTGILKRIRN